MNRKPIRIGNYLFHISQEVYSPHEDSFFMEDVIKNIKLLKLIDPKRVLEIGCGSGYLSVLLKKLFPATMLTAIDINSKAVAITKKNLMVNGIKNGYSVISTNIIQFLDDFDPKKNHSFDLIVFNPPYLPGEWNAADPINIATIGGSLTGDKLITNFLNSFYHNQVTKQILSPNGFIILLIASWNREAQRLITNEKLFEIIKDYKRTINFETLYVYLLTLSS